jgi:hypothetical protein
MPVVLSRARNWTNGIVPDLLDLAAGEAGIGIILAGSFIVVKFKGVADALKPIGRYTGLRSAPPVNSLLVSGICYTIPLIPLAFRPKEKSQKPT